MGQTSMPEAGFEPVLNKQDKTSATDRTATGAGINTIYIVCSNYVLLATSVNTVYM